AQQQDHEARIQAEQQLRAVGDEVHCSAANMDDLAGELREWVNTQERLNEAKQRREQDSARLDQLLDGRTIQELENQIVELTAEAGTPSFNEFAQLEDRSEEAAALENTHRALRDTVAELSGQLASAEKQLLDVSKAIEVEAYADAEERRLTTL